MTETIAITAWNNIVSPLYDFSCRLLIIRPGGGRSSVDIRHLSLPERAELCSREGISVLICGAISNIARTYLQDKDIRVLPWVRGPIEQLIEAYRGGADLGAGYSMPGCGGQGRCGRGGRRRRRRGCRI
jgi:hypothetical protein